MVEPKKIDPPFGFPSTPLRDHAQGTALIRLNPCHPCPGFDSFSSSHATDATDHGGLSNNKLVG
jgi:hypothetical protein